MLRWSSPNGVTQAVWYNGRVFRLYDHTVWLGPNPRVIDRGCATKTPLGLSAAGSAGHSQPPWNVHIWLAIVTPEHTPTLVTLCPVAFGVLQPWPLCPNSETQLLAP